MMLSLRRSIVPLVALLLLSGAASAEERRARPWMGVLLGDPHAAAAKDAEPQPGVPLAGIVSDGPADAAGLRARDRILAVDGVPMRTVQELIAHIREQPLESWISLTVQRQGKERQVRLRLDERPTRGIGRLSIREGWIGIAVIDLPEKLSRHFGVPEGAGVMVADVAGYSTAEAAGFEIGDVIYQVEGQPVRDSGHLNGLIGRGGTGNTLEFTVTRSGVEMVLEALIVEVPESDPFRESYGN